MSVHSIGSLADSVHSSGPSEAEKHHFSAILQAFSEYSKWMDFELRRRETHHAKLGSHLQALLPKGLLKQKSEAVRAGVHFNQQVLSHIAASQRDELGLAELAAPATVVAASSMTAQADGSISAAGSKTDQTEKLSDNDTPLFPDALLGAAPLGSSPSHFHAVKAMLRLLVRDWSAEGMLERELCYGPLLAELNTYLPVTLANRGQQRVLVPGCGLGRLPLEVAARGYDAQGNDASYFMMFASSYIMNKVTSPNSMRIYPWIHNSNNHFRPADMLRPVQVPDVAPADMLAVNPALRITMSSGGFMETYGGEDHDGQWDGVVTSFFLDTAPVALEYMLRIYSLLKPGGVWCNMGPLQYHWAARPDPASSSDGGEGPTAVHDGPDSAFSEGYDRSVELTYLEIRHACVAAGFQFLSEATRTCTYSADLHGMAKTVYSCVLFSVRKPLAGEKVLPVSAVPERQSSFGGASVSSTTAAADGLGGLTRLRVPRAGVGAGVHAGGRATPASDGAGNGTDADSALGALAEVASASAAASAAAGALSVLSDAASSAVTAAGAVAHLKDSDGDIAV